MPKWILISLCFCAQAVRGQQLDSIFFNLYTDSLKPGTHNYINVVGRYTDGRYLPLTDRELNFTASAGRFEGNSLILPPSDSLLKYVVVHVQVRDNSALREERIIHVKQQNIPERLPTVEEILDPQRKKKSRQSGNKR